VNEHTRIAHEATAAHFGIPVSEVRRSHVRAARRAGAHAVSERAMAGRVRGPAKPPLDAVPDGYAVQQITSRTDADGSVRGQSIKARPMDPDEAVQVPEGEGWREIRRSVYSGPDGETQGGWRIFVPHESGPALGLFERLARSFEGVPLAPAAPPPEHTEAELLTLYPLGDPHIGLRALDGSGLQDGADTLIAGMRDLVLRGPRTRTAIVASMGDFYHADDPRNTTRRGGFPLDVDGEWFEILKVGRDVFIAAVSAAPEHHERVEVKILPGNHDDLSAMFLALIADAHFRDEPRVTIDTSGDAFQWFEFGRVLLGFHHGHEVKKERRGRLFSVMANHQAEAWGRTIHRHFFLGHVHHDTRHEHDGLIVESVRTLAKPDSHAHRYGYTSGQDLKRIVFHSERGEISREMFRPC